MKIGEQKKKQKGFTLIEIMIVLAIVGLLFSFVGVNLMGRFKKAKLDAAKIQIASYQQALQAYYLSHSMYPHTTQGLEALISKPSVGKIPENYPEGGYFGKKKLVEDPWGHPYRYECDDYQNHTITSDGPDGEGGSEDDIKSE
ncbi:MAG: type II secretion system major pseudopilin GspG [Deltaproteobacteria bacterium]|nr:type II secretion system major pseudopilin GspG [Deltaproteobacteria bacterium]